MHRIHVQVHDLEHTKLKTERIIEVTTEQEHYDEEGSCCTSKLSVSSRIFSPTTRSSMSVNMVINVVMVSIHLSTHQ